MEEQPKNCTRLPDKIFISLTKNDIIGGWQALKSKQRPARETKEHLCFAVANKLVEKGANPAELPYFKLVGGENTFSDYFAVYGAGDWVICIRRGITYFVEVYDYQQFFNRISRQIDQLITLYTALTNLDPQKRKQGQSILNAKSIISSLME